MQERTHFRFGTASLCAGAADGDFDAESADLHPTLSLPQPPTLYPPPPKLHASQLRK